MKKIIFYISLCFISNILIGYGQDRKACISELIECEKAYSMHVDSNKAANYYMSYSVKIVDWEEGATVSNVKIYRDQNNMHFISEQAQIFNDSKEVLMVLPGQKLLILSSTDKRLNNIRTGDELLQMRKSFIDSCDLVKYEKLPNGNKLLVLKSNPSKTNASVKISSITYEYNAEQKKIVNAKVTYNNTYKIKQMTVVYNDFNPASKHKYSPVRSYYADRKGHVIDKYKDYELVDNRDVHTNKRSK